MYKQLLIAVLLYAGLIVLVCVHPVGRQVELNLLIKPSPQSIIVTVWMLGTAAIPVLAFSGATPGKKMQFGCLGALVAAIVVLAVILAGLIPNDWEQREREMFVGNLVTVTTLPCLFVFLAGLWTNRRAQS